MPRSREEIEAAIDAFTVADLARLKLDARRLPRSRTMSPDDLVNEAYVRALDGRRQCPEHLDVLTFLKGIMSSIASGETQKERRTQHVSIDTGDPDDQSLAIADPADDPHSQAVNAQREKEIVALYNDVYDLFAGDEVALRMLKGIEDGLTGAELRIFVGLNQTAYESKRKAFIRKLKRFFPEGFNK